MGSLLAELESREILTDKTVRDLREYISRKNPTLSSAAKAGIFADAVNRMLDDKIPRLSDEQNSQLRSVIFRSAIRKQAFSIDGSDIFKSSLKLMAADDYFIDQLSSWSEMILQKPVDRDTVSRLVSNSVRMMYEFPDMDVGDIVYIAEKEIAAVSNVLPDIEEGRHEPEYVDIPEYRYVNEASGTNTPAQTVIPAGISIQAGIKVFFLRRKVGVLAGIVLFLAMTLFMYFSAVDINATKEAGIQPVYAAEQMLREEYLSYRNIISERTSRSADKSIHMKATAYDLSFESCGKSRSHPEYGITFSGTKATAGRTIAVDPEVIPLGSCVRITFPEKYSHLDGIYIAEDTGSLIKGNIIDVFFGEDEAGSSVINEQAMEFGVQDVDVEIIDDVEIIE